MKTHHIRTLFQLCLPLWLAIVMLALPALNVRADTFIVTKTADTDDGVCNADCSLREAIAAAGAGDTITFDAGLAGETLLLESELLITETLTLDGSALAAHVKISGNAAVRVFNIAADADVAMTHLDIINGFAKGASYPISGGGIRNSGVLTLTACTLSGNRATDYGGGIHSNGALALIDTILDNNSSEFGGGIFNSASGKASINSSAIMNNRATIWNGGGVYNNGGAITITASTISGNSAAAEGGGIYNTFGGPVTLIASTVASNTAQTGGGLINWETLVLSNSLIGNNAAANSPDCEGTLISQDYNLIENTTSCTPTHATAHNIIGLDPQLGPLADNGGATPTHALLKNSPALNHIPNGVNDCGGALPQDQRGFPRPYPTGGACDIGAYERESRLALAKSVAPALDAPYHGLITYTITLRNTSQVEEINASLGDTLPSAVNFGDWIEQPINAAVNSDVISWQGALATGEMLTFTFSADHTGDYGEIVTNTVRANDTVGEISAQAAFTLETNLPPIANAGDSQMIAPGAIATLDGSGSYDPDGDALSYAWTQTGGVAVSFTPTLSRTTFTAPTQSGALTFTLAVSDSHSLSSDDTVVINVAAHRIYLPLILK